MTKSNEFVLLYSLVVLAAGAGTAASASAEDPTVSVRYRAYELQSPAGTRAVYKRIQRAAANACRTEVFIAQRGCRSDLEQQMLGQIGSPAMLALAGRGKRIQLADRGA